MSKKGALAANAAWSVRISARGVARLQAGHVWVYRSDITDANNVPPGALVGVTDSRGKFLGTALYSGSSQIAVRMIAREPVADLCALIAERIRAAILYRERMVAASNAYRVVFSEADFLPGLIVDRYHDVLSVQILTQAMDAAPVRAAVLETLVEQLKPAGIVERVDARIRELEQLPARKSGLLWGEKSSTIVSLSLSLSLNSGEAASGPAEGASTSAVRFYYDGLEGQKTGAFLDQRENYVAAAQYAHGAALDVFCYQGGFVLHLAGKCSSVTGVDSSRPALEMAEKNARLNEREVEWIEGNAFDLLKDYAAEKRQYDTIVLDPPAFAKSKHDLDNARRGYKELNLRALKMLRPGGVLVTCSCSFHLSPQDFLETVAEAARDAHRSARILENRGQAKDHPILLGVPETGYLKCMVIAVN